MTKEEGILKAAKEVFFTCGFQNAKIEQIAKEAGCSKVTLYKYFESKENLFMALTYDAFQRLIEEHYKSVAATKNKTGLEGLLELTQNFIQFCIDKADYAELIVNYRNIAKQVIKGNEVDKITAAMRNSDYYRRIMHVQKLPIQIIVDEIKRGQADGSITKQINPWVIHHIMWSTVFGFLMIPIRSGEDKLPNIELSEWRNSVLKTVEALAKGAI